MQIFGNSSGGALWQRVPQLLYLTGVVAGNGADTTEDTMQSFTLPAGTLRSVGDRIHLVAGGTLAASTDTKTARVRWAGTIIAALQGTLVGNTGWSIDLWIVKTGSNTQSLVSNGGVINASAFPTFRSGTLTATDTNTIAITVTGQNSTAATANSITCQYLSIEYIH